MNREIKFRAWNVRLQKMTPTINLYDPIYNFDWLGLYDFPIMQYTGLKDGNDNEIYEGDILSAKGANSDTWKVYWCLLSCSFRILNVTHKRWANEYSKSMTESFCYKHFIIGNIYENPNFLTN